MKEINEAYEVLSDETKRTQYNERNKGTFEDYEFGDDIIQSAFDNARHAQEADWQIALEYYPDLTELAIELRRTSKKRSLPLDQSYSKPSASLRENRLRNN